MKVNKSMKELKKTIIFSGLSILICLSMLAGTTFAWFTDSAVNTGNNIQTGILDIQADGYILKNDEWNTAEPVKNLSAPMITEQNWEPGQKNAFVVRVSNKSSTLSAKVDIKFDITKDENGIAKALWYKITPVVSESADVNEAVSTDKMIKEPPEKEGDSEVVTIAEIESAAIDPQNLSVTSKNGGNDKIYAYYLIEYGMYSSEDKDTYQNAEFGMDFEVTATQSPDETDGFGNSDYDKNAKPETE